MGGNPIRLKAVFDKSLEIAGISKSYRSRPFPEVAVDLCKDLGFTIAIDTSDSVGEARGLSLTMPDGSMGMILSQISAVAQDRLVFYHELAHLMLDHMDSRPEESWQRLRDVAEAEAWLFSISCVAHDQVTPGTDVLKCAYELLPILSPETVHIAEAVFDICKENWIALPEETPYSEQGIPLIIDIGELLIKKIVKNPELIYQVGSQPFEDLMAELFKGLGYSVEQTKRTRDGGVDILAVTNLHKVPLRFLVECKRYSKERRVDVALVRSLYGVKHHIGASKAILATTSGFTRPAVEFAEAHLWELDLKDIDGIMSWIHQYVDRKEGPTITST